jgi:hypothetical protein
MTMIDLNDPKQVDDVINSVINRAMTEYKNSLSFKDKIKFYLREWGILRVKPTTFYDKFGKQISGDEWLKLNDTPKYRTIKVSHANGCSIFTNWTGFSKERLFEVSILKDIKTIFHSDYANRDVALVAHNKILERLRGRE